MSSSFATARSFLDTPATVRERITEKLKIPWFFFDKMHLESNGFSGCEVRFGRNQEVEAYSKPSDLSTGSDNAPKHYLPSSSTLVAVRHQANVRETPGETNVHALRAQPRHRSL